MASSVHPVIAIVKLFVLPAQWSAFVSTTVISPFTEPKLTVIWLLFGPLFPAVIDAPEGTVHA